MTRFPMLASLSHTATMPSSKNCTSSIPTTSVRDSTASQTSWELETDWDLIRSSLCETMWSMSNRSSIRGLKICTRCRPIWARRSRRINSSLFPLNMLPQMTSTHPTLPRIMLFISLLVVKGRERADQRDHKRMLSGQDVPGEHAPSSLLAPNIGLFGEPIDGNAEFDSPIDDRVGDFLRNQNVAAAAEGATVAVGDISPALQKRHTLPSLLHHVKPAFHPDVKIGFG